MVRLSAGESSLGSRANDAVASGRIDFAAFGRAFLANPDLIERLRNGWTLNRPDPQTYYSQGMRGYNDYATFRGNSGMNQADPDTGLA
jgi:N-ethylmaleimide reductase